jgi:hypothetical protein
MFGLGFPLSFDPAGQSFDLGGAGSNGLFAHPCPPPYDRRCFTVCVTVDLGFFLRLRFTVRVLY